jgi:hypothetical protein
MLIGTETRPKEMVAVAMDRAAMGVMAGGSAYRSITTI